MPIYRSPAVVIKSINLGEADKIVTIYTQRYGKICGVAKGARKLTSRFLGSLETFTYTHLIYFGKENQNLYRINSSDTIRSFCRIREDLDKICFAMCALELIDTMVGYSSVNGPLFSLLVYFLSVMEKNNTYSRTLLRIFEIRLLYLLGYMPQLNRCVVCGAINLEKDKIGFDFVQKGIVCCNCMKYKHTITEITHGTKKFILKSINMKLTNIERLRIPKGLEQELKDFTRLYLTTYTARTLRAYEFLNQIDKKYYTFS